MQTRVRRPERLALANTVSHHLDHERLRKALEQCGLEETWENHIWLFRYSSLLHLNTCWERWCRLFTFRKDFGWTEPAEQQEIGQMETLLFSRCITLRHLLPEVKFFVEELSDGKVVQATIWSVRLGECRAYITRPLLPPGSELDELWQDALETTFMC